MEKYKYRVDIMCDIWQQDVADESEARDKVRISFAETNMWVYFK